MTGALSRVLRTTACAILIGTLTAGAANATEGYFQEGVSPREKATGGAGVADPRDALTIANNPAGLVDVGTQANLDLTVFSPDRWYNATGTALVAPGTYKSTGDAFFIPTMAFSRQIDGESAWGIAIYGNGGMNSAYNAANAGPACPAGSFGVFCNGKAGVDLNQAFMSAGYAKRVGAFSFGVAPIVAIPMFRAYGLGAFGAFGLSSNPAELSGNGTAWSVGGGLRAGVEWHATPTLRFGLAGATPIWSTSFEKYSGLFANQGQFDIPGTITVGTSYDILPMLTLLLDYKHIFYSGVPAISNSPNFNGILFGAAGGPGFGWRDVDVVSFGAEWRATQDLILRAGYSHNTNPISSADVTMNILAPGVITDHVSAGASYKVLPNASLEFAAVYAPRQDVGGPEVTPFGATPGSNINIWMSQFEITAGLTYYFDTPTNPVVVSKY